MKKVKIKFILSKYRKHGVDNKFDARLTPYWEKQLTDMFRKWK